jgi:hypothetical protein
MHLLGNQDAEDRKKCVALDKPRGATLPRFLYAIGTMTNETLTSDFSVEAIRSEAYRIYLESGRVEGRDLENWLLAKRLFRDFEATPEFLKPAETEIHFPLNAKASSSNTHHPYPQLDPNEPIYA